MSTDATANDVRTYLIGGLNMAVQGHRLCQALDSLQGMETFATDGPSAPDIVVEEATVPATPDERVLYTFDLNDGYGCCRMLTDVAGNTGYRFGSGSMLVHDRLGKGHVRLDWRGDLGELRYMLWLAYAHAALPHEAVPVHSSVVVWHDRAVLCLGESGTGKSTHTRLWLNNFEGAWLLNDDSPIVRIEQGRVWAYGSPWSGKTPCFRQQRVEVGALLRLKQAPENRIERAKTLIAFASLQPSCPPSMIHDERCADQLIDFVGRVIERVPVYRLDCLPDLDAARLSRDTIFSTL